LKNLIKTMKQFLALCLALAVFTQCNSKTSKTFKKLPSGIEYKLVTEGKGKQKPKVGDIIKMHIRVYVSDSMAFDSYKLNNNEPVPAQIQKPQFNGDIMEGIAMLVEGDSAVFQIPQDSAYRNGMKPPFAKAGDKVIYQIKMISVKTEAQFKEEQAKESKVAVAKEAGIIDEYIKKNNLQNVVKTESGLCYIITKPGAGPNVPKGAKVSMNYTGMLMDGTKFDSNVDPKFSHVEPFTFPLGEGKVIPGWDEGVSLLNKGAKATLIIPSPYAYGPRAQGPIPANSILIFDVEVTDYK
jgi:FKBP-type peptidyl-prolyl cis-trans isomerase FkpA